MENYELNNVENTNDKTHSNADMIGGMVAAALVGFVGGAIAKIVHDNREKRRQEEAEMLWNAGRQYERDWYTKQQKTKEKTERKSKQKVS